MAIVGFSGDPERVTELLQLTPTKVARRETHASNARRHRSNGWWLEVHADKLSDGAQHDAALSGLIEQLRGRAERFEALRNMLKPTSVTIYGGLHVTRDEQSGIWLDPDAMQVLANCGVGWGLDIFVKDVPSECKSH